MKTLIENDTFPFGKHKGGVNIDWMCRHMPFYCLWWHSEIKQYPLHKELLILAIGQAIYQAGTDNRRKVAEQYNSLLKEVDYNFVAY